MSDRELLEWAAKRNRERHGMDRTPEHRAWVSMKQRCTNQKKREWPHYGGRGIAVCPEWMRSFTAFYAHVGKRPSEKHSIDRIDVNGDYAPGNVRWATQQEQIDNTTVVRMVSINGRSQSISAWEREMGLSKGQVKSREKSGWTTEAAILTPSIKGQKKVMTVKRDYSQRTRGEHGRYQSETR